VQVKHLAGAEARSLLTACSGLSADSVQQLTSGNVDSLSIDDRRKLLQDVFKALSAADALPEYEMISMPRMRVAVSQSLCECLLSVYGTVYASLQDENSAQEIKSPSQVATLLGVPEESIS
jgi:hypothetical protein